MRAWRIAKALLSTSYATMVEYRAELILWMLANSLPFILMGVWTQAAQNGAFAISPVDFVRYFLVVFVVRQLTMVWVIWDFEPDLQRGRLQHLLMQPLDPAWRYVAAHIAERGARLPFTVLLVVAFFVIDPEARFVPHALDVATSFGFCVLAFCLRFLLQYTLAQLCFFVERASSSESLMFIFYLFMSGAVAPLDVFPPAVRDVVMLTPFPYLIFVPARVLLGQSELVDVPRALLVVGAWCVVLFVVNRVMWRAGLRRQSVGGA